MRLYRVVLTAPFVAVVIGISVLSHIPQPPVPDMGFNLADKVLHVIAYFVFGLSLQFALRAWRPLLSGRQITIAVVVGTALFGIYDELHQMMVPNRVASVGDWLADLIGGALSLVMRAFVRMVSEKLRNYFQVQDTEKEKRGNVYTGSQ